MYCRVFHWFFDWFISLLFHYTSITELYVAIGGRYRRPFIFRATLRWGDPAVPEEYLWPPAVGFRSALDQVPGDVSCGGRPQRGATVRGDGETAIDCVVLDHRRQWYDGHWRPSGQRVLDTGHGQWSHSYLAAVTLQTSMSRSDGQS